MESYSLVALILVVTAGAALFNRRLLRLPESVGLMATALIVSLAFLVGGLFLPGIVQPVCERVEAVDFSFVVLDLLLGFLIFAGAFSADAAAMSRERWPILVFATVGILISTAVVGLAMWVLLEALGMGIPLLHCLLFGALISPTDPIAVLAILKTTGVPRALQADIAGESLLNDGVAVVVFLTLFQLAGGASAGGHGSMQAGIGVFEIMTLFGREVAGGVVLGAAGGFLASRALRVARIETVDILITVATVMGVYAVAWRLHVSGPLAIVVVGIILGQAIRSQVTTVAEREHVSVFWDAMDHLLNAVLFTMMGFVLLGLVGDYQPLHLVAGLFAIPMVLAARLLSLSATVPLTKLRCGNVKSTLSLLTWGGLRGGISIALALSLQPEMSRELIVFVTYVVVVFSILAQGLSIGALVRKLGVAGS